MKRISSNVPTLFAVVFSVCTVFVEASFRSKPLCEDLPTSTDPSTYADRTKTYVALLRSSSSPRVALDIASRLQALQYPNESTSEIHVLRGGRPGVVFTGSSSALHLLCSNRHVEMIEEDEVVVTSDSEEIGQHRAPYHLDRIDQRSLPLNGLFLADGNGSTVEIFVLDSGINYNHEEFGGRAVYGGYDAIDHQGIWGQERKGRDCFGHGTLVASIAAGKTYGVAPGALLRSIRVLPCNKMGTVVRMMKGLDYIIAQKKANPGRKIIIVCSLLATHVRKDLNVEIEEAFKAGIPVVVAAGNWNRDACNYSPASSPYAIVVGASNHHDDIFKLSNYGKCVDIFAPGVNIRGAGFPCLDCTVYKSGTSFAAPVVAGVIALMMEKNPDITPSQIKSRLFNTCSRNKMDFLYVPSRFRPLTPNCLIFAPKKPVYIVKLGVDMTNFRQLVLNHSHSGYLPVYISASMNLTYKGDQGMNIIFKLTKNARNATFITFKDVWATRSAIKKFEEEGNSVSVFRSCLMNGKQLRFVAMVQPSVDLVHPTTLWERVRLPHLNSRLQKQQGVSTPTLISAVYCNRFRPIFSILNQIHKKGKSRNRIQPTSRVQRDHIVIPSVATGDVDNVISRHYGMGYFLKDMDTYGSCSSSNHTPQVDHVLLFHLMEGSQQDYELYKFSPDDAENKMADLVSQGKHPIMVNQVGETYLAQFKLV